MHDTHTTARSAPPDAVGIADVIDYALRQFGKELSAYHAGYDSQDQAAMLRAEQTLGVIIDRLESYRLHCAIKWGFAARANPNTEHTHK